MDTQNLFNKVMAGAWEEVVHLCGQDPNLLITKFPGSGNTVLHMAVLAGQDTVGEQLIKLMVEKGYAEPALIMPNELGNRPLHSAAVMGSVPMCKCIAEVDPRLIRQSNCEGESPFFLAVLHGNKDAFLCLHSICERMGRAVGYQFSIRFDGSNILHSAITGEYLDLAFLIIHLYPDLCKWHNQQGLSPMHILATKPSLFRSGSHGGRFRNVIYRCLSVDELAPLTTGPAFPLDIPVGDGDGVGVLDLVYPAQTTGGSTSTPDVSIPLESVPSLPTIGGSTSTPDVSISLESVPSLPTTGGSTSAPDVPVPLESVPPLPTTGGSSPTPDIQSTSAGRKGHRSFDVKFLSNAVFGLAGLRQMKERKQKHVWSNQVLNGLLEHGGDSYPYVDRWSGVVELSKTLPDEQGLPIPNEAIPEGERKRMLELKTKRMSPIMVAAKNGIFEMVDKILQRFPVAIEDQSSEGKNVLLLAVENRQPEVYRLLLEKLYTMKDIMFHKIDKDGNGALHLAAKLGDHDSWLNQDAALHMQRDIKWYQCVKDSMPVSSGARYNFDGDTPDELFVKTHKDVVKVAAEWLTHTAESCSFVAALVATVAFSTSATIPGGVKQDVGTPALKGEVAFYVFAVSSLVALCFSVTSTVIFLAILTSGFQIKEFHTSLPRKLLAGLGTLSVSIIAMLFSFCASHFFILKDLLGYGAFGLYAAVAFMPVIMAFFLISRFPHSFDLMWATFTNRPMAIPPPERSDEMILP